MQELLDQGSVGSTDRGGQLTDQFRVVYRCVPSVSKVRHGGGFSAELPKPVLRRAPEIEAHRR